MNTNTLEYIFSHSLKLTQHIGNQIKNNTDNKLNGMIRIWGKHRMEFDSALWNSVLRPTTAYVCLIWFPSSAAQIVRKSSISSSQNYYSH